MTTWLSSPAPDWFVYLMLVVGLAVVFILGLISARSSAKNRAGKGDTK